MKKTPSCFFVWMSMCLVACTNNDPKPATPTSAPLVTTVSHPYFIHLSDIHLDSYSDATSYGEDTGMDLWEITYQKLDSILNSAAPPQFVLYTGDLPAHDESGQTTTRSQCGDQHAYAQDSTHTQNIKVLLKSLYALFVQHRKIPFFYLPGNNDGLRCDYCSFNDNSEGTLISLFPQDSLPAIHADDNCGAPPCILDKNLSMGYYAARVMPGLRLVALNSIIFGHKYIVRDKICQEDAGNQQMTWLRAQLADASKAGEKVYLAMHIPPGIDAHSQSPMWARLPARNPWLNQFLSLLNDNQATVTGIMFGHTHMDEVRRLYDPQGTNITEVAISAPGISPIHNNNPGFKLVYFDPASKELTDFLTCYTTPGAGTYGHAGYRFSSTFGAGNAKTIYECLKSMEINTLDSAMNTIYLVKKKTASSSSTIGGIEVRTVQ